MATTKEKILETALTLFNELGTSEVSSRLISETMGISYGNLCYHFAKKSDIILKLHENYETEITLQFENMQREIFRLDFMVKSLRSLMNAFYRYRFILLENHFLTRKYEPIAKNTKRHFYRRANLLREMSKFLEGQGLLRPEEIKGHHEMSINNMLILLNSWVHHHEWFYKGWSDSFIDYYIDMFYGLFRAWLTEAGKKSFDNVYRLLKMEYKVLDQENLPQQIQNPLTEENS